MKEYHFLFLDDVFVSGKKQIDITELNNMAQLGWTIKEVQINRSIICILERDSKWKSME